MSSLFLAMKSPHASCFRKLAIYGRIEYIWFKMPVTRSLRLVLIDGFVITEDRASEQEGLCNLLIASMPETLRLFRPTFFLSSSKWKPL